MSLYIKCLKIALKNGYYCQTRRPQQGLFSDFLLGIHHYSRRGAFLTIFCHCMNFLTLVWGHWRWRANKARTSPAARTRLLPRMSCIQKETHYRLTHNIQVPIVHVSLLLELSGLQRQKQVQPCVCNASAGSRTRRGGVCSEREITLPNWQGLNTSGASFSRMRYILVMVHL